MLTPQCFGSCSRPTARCPRDCRGRPLLFRKDALRFGCFFPPSSNDSSIRVVSVGGASLRFSERRLSERPFEAVFIVVVVVTDVAGIVSIVKRCRKRQKIWVRCDFQNGATKKGRLSVF